MRLDRSKREIAVRAGLTATGRTPRPGAMFGEGGNGCRESYGFLPWYARRSRGPARRGWRGRRADGRTLPPASRRLTRSPARRRSSTSLGGSLSLMLVYGYVLLQGADLISSGSELLLEILDPGLIGGLVLPILGALPDAAIIVISGSKASPDEVAVGVGTLAGSTILLLTVVWGGSTYLGRCDLDGNNESINKVLTRPYAFNSTGVTSSTMTTRNALIMILTAVPMLVVQLPASLIGKDDEDAQNTIVFVGAVLCLMCLVLYLIYQLVSPELLKSKIRAARSKVRPGSAHPAPAPPPRARADRAPSRAGSAG